MNRSTVLGLVMLMAPTAALAQLIGGAVIDADTREPLARIPVRLIQSSLGGPTVVALTATDSSGLFQLLAPTPGIFRLAFGDVVRPISQSPPDSIGPEAAIVRQFLVPFRAHQFLEPEVERAARPQQGIGGPKYPVSEREAGRNGAVTARFVVDASGRVVKESIEIVFTTSAAFAATVREFLVTARFAPARWREYDVRQVMEQPFTFTVERWP